MTFPAQGHWRSCSFGRLWWHILNPLIIVVIFNLLQQNIAPLVSAALFVLYLFCFGRPVLLRCWFFHHGWLYWCSCWDVRGLGGKGGRIGEKWKQTNLRHIYHYWYLSGVWGFCLMLHLWGNFCAFGGTAGDQWRRWNRGRRLSLHTTGNCSCLQTE